MSNEATGDAAVTREAIDASRKLFDAGRVEAEEQLDLLGLPTPEQMLEARERLGPDAGQLSILQEARRGRPKGARNKRTDDYARFLLQHGQDPGIVMIQIASTPPEALMEASKRTVTKVVKDRVVTYTESLSYQEAQSLRLRAAEGVQPYINSKKPVAIDATIRGVRIIEEVASTDPMRNAIEGEFLRVASPDDMEEPA